MAGINMSNLSSNEAIFPDLYPEIVSSTPFLMEMMEVRVETLDGEVKANMYGSLPKISMVVMYYHSSVKFFSLVGRW